MKVRVPMMIQDEFTSKRKMMRLIEDFTIEGESFFLDGPVLVEVLYAQQPIKSTGKSG